MADQVAGVFGQLMQQLQLENNRLTTLPATFTQIVTFTALWLGCNQLTMLPETSVLGNGIYTKLGALAVTAVEAVAAAVAADRAPRAGIFPAVETKEIPSRPRCQLCRHKPGRRIVCRCTRRVGPCCWNIDQGMCVSCASQEPEPEP